MSHHYPQHQIPYTLEDLELDHDVVGGELDLDVEIDPGQVGQFSGPPENCCEHFEPSASVIGYKILTATLMNEECEFSESTDPLHIEQVEAWITRTDWTENETLCEQLLEECSQDD